MALKNVGKMRLETIPKGDGVKVVIGTRTYLGPDWIHVDIDPTPLYDHVNKQQVPVDGVCDARKLDMPDNYADIVYNSECLEHLQLFQLLCCSRAIPDAP